MQISVQYKNEINNIQKVTPIEFVNNILKPLLKDKKVISELSSMEFQSQKDAFYTYEYMTNKGYNVIAQDETFIAKLQNILIAQQELNDLEQKLDIVQKQLDALPKQLNNK